MAKLRPINETRRANGTLTSETAARLFRRRGGLAIASILRKDGFKQLEKARAISILVRRSKSLQKRSCGQCKGLAEVITKQLAQLKASQQQVASTIHPDDQAKL